MTDGDNKRIERIINLCNDCKFAACEQCEINYGDVFAIKHLKEELEELKQIEEEHKKENGELREKELMNQAMIEDSISKGIVGKFYIPKQKIKDKIEELEKDKEECQIKRENAIDEEKEYWRKEKIYRSLQIYILQELLEGG